MISAASNFDFLSASSPQIAKLGALAEWALHVDPPTSILKIRQFSEELAKLVAARQGALAAPGEGFAEMLSRPQRAGSLPTKAADVFHHLRRLGNASAHGDRGSAAQALSSLKLARELGVWFHRTFTDPGFAPTPFSPPEPPRDISEELARQIEELRSKLVASEDAAARAQREANEAIRRSESESERASREADERAQWELLAGEAEAARGKVEAELRALQAANADQPATEKAQRAAIAAGAAERIVVDEADTRVLVDAQLAATGWEADSLRLRHSLGTRPLPKRAMAIAEWPTETGPVDYALFVDGACVGVIEAKRSAIAVPAALEQAKRYARSIRLTPDETAADAPFAHGLDESYRAPFVFATNGRPYLRQLETQSGVWFWDARRAVNRPVALPDWFTPRDLTERLEQEVAPAGLAEDGPDVPGVRPYQRDAIDAVEKAVADGLREILVAMATGTGKTLTCANLGWHHPELDRLVEISSAWGHFPDLMHDHIQRGYKVGASAAADEHRGRPGGGAPGASVFGVRGGLTGVIADSLDRATIGKALRARRTFATTGERLAAFASCGDHRQGDEFAHSGKATVSYRFLGDAGWDEIQAFDHTGCFWRRSLQEEAGLSDRMIRLRWGGARIRDRYRWAVWKGTITVTNAVIHATRAHGLEHKEEAVWRVGATQIGFRTDTYGDTDAVEIELTNLAAARIRVEGSIDGYVKVGDPLKGNPFVHCPTFCWEVTGAELIAAGSLHLPLGGADLALDLDLISAAALPRDVAGMLEIEPRNGPHGFRPVYFVGRQADDAKAMTSPLFIAF